MKISINHDLSCINAFTDIFRDKNDISKHKITKLLYDSSYQNLIKDIGKNFSLCDTYEWIQIFNLAYESFKNNKNFMIESLFVNLAILSIRDAFNNIEKLQEYTEEIISTLNKKEFIEKTKSYLPHITQEVTVTVVYSVFMRNAVVENNKIYIDIPFARLLNKYQLNDLLSHELHHYLKKFCEPNIIYSNSSPQTINFLKMLESEGIANLCNFKSIYPVYRLLGINAEILNSEDLKEVEENIISFLKILEERISNNNLNKSFDVEFIENLKYIGMSYHMAKSILDAYGIDTIRGLVGKPIPFLKSYLECSKLNESNKYLSEKSMIILNDI